MPSVLCMLSAWILFGTTTRLRWFKESVFWKRFRQLKLVWSHFSPTALRTLSLVAFCCCRIAIHANGKLSVQIGTFHHRSTVLPERVGCCASLRTCNRFSVSVRGGQWVTIEFERYRTKLQQRIARHRTRKAKISQTSFSAKGPQTLGMPRSTLLGAGKGRQYRSMWVGQRSANLHEHRNRRFN